MKSHRNAQVNNIPDIVLVAVRPFAKTKQSSFKLCERLVFGKGPVATVTAMAMWAEIRQLTLAQARKVQKGMHAWTCRGTAPDSVHCFVPVGPHVNDYSRRDGGIHKSGWGWGSELNFPSFSLFPMNSHLHQPSLLTFLNSECLWDALRTDL